MFNHYINGIDILPCSGRMITTLCYSLKKVITIHKLLILINFIPINSYGLKRPYVFHPFVHVIISSPSRLYHSNCSPVLSLNFPPGLMHSEAGGQGSAIATSTALTYPCLALSQVKYLSILYLKFLVEICFL